MKLLILTALATITALLITSCGPSNFAGGDPLDRADDATRSGEMISGF